MPHKGRKASEILDLALKPCKMKENMERPSKQEYFMQIAKDVSSRSTCIRRQHGAVIVRNDQFCLQAIMEAQKGCHTVVFWAVYGKN